MLKMSAWERSSTFHSSYSRRFLLLSSASLICFQSGLHVNELLIA